MKINTIKFLVVTMLILMVCGIVVGLFLLEIPPGNREVAYTILGTLIASTIHAISDLFKKGETR